MFDPKTFAFDPAGNLLDQKTQELNRPLESDPRRNKLMDNLLREYAGTHYQYDERGNLIHRLHNGDKARLTWDLFDRLVRFDDGKLSVAYSYDALGRRIAKHSPRGTTRFGWDGMQMIEEHGQNGHMLTLYEPHSYTPLARIDQGPLAANDEATTYWYHTTPTGLPEELTDAQGRLVWQARYQCWGNLALESYPEHAPNTDPTRITQLDANLRNPGQYHDRETGLFYNTFRYYDPDIGRFTTEDPIGLAGGSNLYQYAPNPLSWIDPWGWEVYELIAKKDGWYPVMEYGKKQPIGSVYLKEGELWKIGETKNPNKRYSTAKLDAIGTDIHGNPAGVTKRTISHDTDKARNRVMERQRLKGHAAMHGGRLPPGNKCTH